MVETLLVRPVTDQDIEPARDVTNRSWVSTYTPLIGNETTLAIIEDRHSAERFAMQAADAASKSDVAHFLVAEMDDRIVGHCYAFEKDGCYVDRLHVEPILKGHGIGRAMLEYVEAQQPAGARIWLDVLRGNDSAIAFYKRVGYQLIGETDACGGLAGIPALIFEKTVRPY